MRLRIKYFFVLLLCFIISSQSVVTFIYAQDNTISVDVQSSTGGEPDPEEHKGYSMGGVSSGKIPDYNTNARIAMDGDFIGMGTVKTYTLYVRQAPSVLSNKLGSLKKGDTINIINRVNSWYKINYNGKLGYVSAAYINLIPFEKGIDVSKWQGKIDWNKVKADGIDYVIIRAGYGTSTVDSMFHENIKGAINAGLKVGVYWFSYASSPEKAKVEAQKCLEVMSPYKNSISYPVFFDYEYDSVDWVEEAYGIKVTKELASQIANSFISAIEQNGYETGIYTNHNFGSQYFSDKILHSNNLFIAQYNSECTYEKPYNIWQYTDKGKVNGINSNVDLQYRTLKFSKYNGEGTGWYEIDGKWYYFNESGEMQTGWIFYKNTWYYLNANGEMATGWYEVNGKWYYSDESGAMQTGWISYGNKWYYLKDDGEMATGWYVVDGKWYYSDESGAMQTGWLLCEKKWYYLNANGEMATGWYVVGGKWYYSDKSGAMQTGWLLYRKKWYYLKDNGEMATGWLLSGNKWYYLKSNGEMATNTTIDGWKIDSNGVATKL